MTLIYFCFVLDIKMASEEDGEPDRSDPSLTKLLNSRLASRLFIKMRTMQQDNVFCDMEIQLDNGSKIQECHGCLQRVLRDANKHVVT